jgi:GDP-L-fucose synthase
MYENIAKNFNKVDKIINFDSAACFDRKQNIYNFKEECLGKFIPEDFYGFSKMNIALRSLQVKNSYNLRIFNCFGEKETEDRMTKANLIRYINNDPIIIHKNKFMDLFYISDLFIVLEYFLNNTYLPKDLNLVYEQKNTLLDIANIINSLENKKSQIIINQDGMDNSYTGDFSLINSLNFNFFGLKYGIKSMFSALLERGCKH